MLTKQPTQNIGESTGGSMSGAFLALLRRDLLLAFRRRTELLFPIAFLLVVVSLFPLGIGPGPALLARIAPGVIWIAALLATVISLDSLFRSDFEDGTLEQFILSGHPLTLIVLTKIVGALAGGGAATGPAVPTAGNLDEPADGIAGRINSDTIAGHTHPEPDRFHRRRPDPQPETWRTIALFAGFSALCPHLDSGHGSRDGGFRRPALRRVYGPADRRAGNICHARAICGGGGN